jgi:hypothetical protein
MLGMKLLFEVPNMSFFDCGSVRLMLSTADKPELVRDMDKNLFALMSEVRK